MDLKDIVRQAMVNQGLETLVQENDVVDGDIELSEDEKAKQRLADSSQDLNTEDEENEETKQLLAEILIEFLRKQHISFAQLSAIRKVFKRILLHLCTSEQPCTVGNIRHVIDPRYRTQVAIILQGMTKAGILNMFDDDTAKARWFVSPKYKAQAIMFASER